VSCLRKVGGRAFTIENFSTGYAPDDIVRTASLLKIGGCSTSTDQ
jgi:hypothetical protein